MSQSLKISDLFELDGNTKYEIILLRNGYRYHVGEFIGNIPASMGDFIIVRMVYLRDFNKYTLEVMDKDELNDTVNTDDLAYYPKQEGNYIIAEESGEMQIHVHGRTDPAFMCETIYSIFCKLKEDLGDDEKGIIKELIKVLESKDSE